MKIKVLLIAVVAIMMSCQNLMAGQADDFKYNNQQVQNEFADLNCLEQTVVDNNFMPLSQMQQNNLLTANFSNLNLTNMMMEPALGIPGFWWGCVLGLIGVLCVYLITDHDKAEVKQAFIGCLVGVLISVSVNLIIMAGSL